MAPGRSFAARTCDGYIKVNAADTVDCNVIATIVTWAPTEREAIELAEEIEVSLRPSGSGLAVSINKPPFMINRSADVSLDVAVPFQTNLDLHTSDGSISVAGINGDVTARSSDGSITVEHITGSAHLHTSDGRITCNDVKGDELKLRTSDGSIRLSDALAKSCNASTSDGRISCTRASGDLLHLKTSDGSVTVSQAQYSQMRITTGDGSINCSDFSAERLYCRASDGRVSVRYAEAAPAALWADITTGDGSIHFAGPPALSARIDASTNDGTICTHLPITIKGKVGNSLTGTIGEGEGTLRLRTGDGSITIE
jgi:DUF4097 and DUF4098 domain-containing protein YvlB